MKKFIIIVSLFITSLAFAKEDLKLSISTNEAVYDKLLKPLWEKMPYEYNFNSEAEAVASNLHTQILNARVIVAPKGSPLLSIKPTGDGTLDIKWKFKNLKANIVVKATFRFRKFGVKITHNEIFIVTASSISNALSNINLKFNQGKFDFKLVKNHNFRLDRMHVQPKDGIGRTLRWNFDHVFCRNDVDRYIRDKVNEKLAGWANSGELISKIEKAVNEKLEEAKNIDIKIGELATKLTTNFNHVALSKDNLAINLAAQFDHTDQKVHPCATTMIENKDFVFVSHSLLEGAINNVATYEVWKEGKLQQPVFCMGYKEFNSRGEATGEPAEIKLLLRKVKFNYWVTPLTLPKFVYNSGNNEVTALLKFSIKLESKNIPSLRTKDEDLKAKIMATFKVIHEPTKGVILKFNRLEIPELLGKLQVKWFRFTPYVNTPLDSLKKRIVKKLNKQLREEFSELIILEEEIKIDDELSLKISDYQLLNEGHQINFLLK